MQSPTNKEPEGWALMYAELGNKWRLSQQAGEDWVICCTALQSVARRGEVSLLSSHQANVAKARKKWQRAKHDFDTHLSRMQDEVEELEQNWSPQRPRHLHNCFSVEKEDIPQRQTPPTEVIREDLQQLGKKWSNLKSRHPSIATQVEQIAEDGNSVAQMIVQPEIAARRVEELDEIIRFSQESLRDAEGVLAQMASNELIGKGKDGPIDADQPCRSLANKDIKFGGMETSSVMAGLVENMSSRPLIPKKKTRQLKLKQAFVRKNFQKYPIDKCDWIQEIQNHVYQPPKYRAEFGPSLGQCCVHCYLQPCILVGKRDIFLESLWDDYEDPKFAVQNAFVVVHNQLFKYFGRNYMKRMKLTPADVFQEKVPFCVRKGIEDLLDAVLAKVERDKLKETLTGSSIG